MTQQGRQVLGTAIATASLAATVLCSLAAAGSLCLLALAYLVAFIGSAVSPPTASDFLPLVIASLGALASFMLFRFGRRMRQPDERDA